jgi:hypothetical protein
MRAVARGRIALSESSSGTGRLEWQYALPAGPAPSPFLRIVEDGLPARPRRSLDQPPGTGRDGGPSGFDPAGSDLPRLAAGGGHTGFVFDRQWANSRGHRPQSSCLEIARSNAFCGPRPRPRSRSNRMQRFQSAGLSSRWLRQAWLLLTCSC